MSDPHAIARLPDEWRESLVARRQQAFRAGQVFRWIHQRAVVDAEAMTDLSKALRSELAEELAPPLHLDRVHRSEDDTRKLLVGVEGGAQVETVLLPVKKRSSDADAAAADDEDEDEDEDGDGSVSDARVTQCISTQVGCAMGCVFCASGIAGLQRHLTAAEIIGQVLLGRQLLEPQEALRNVVFMGMGEPLHNYDATARVIRLLTHPDGLGLSPRRITVSTSGLVPEIERLGRDFGGKVGLAISLHQPDDDRRSALMPINKKYPLVTLLEALRAYPLPWGRKITIEYTLVAGQNDDLRDADRLAKLLHGLRVKVNLIPMNPIAHSKLGPPEDDRVLAFQRRLRDAGLLCFVRRRRGDDVSAACGQLVMLGKEPSKAFRRRQPADPE